MSIRQDYIDQFKVYLKMQGLTVYLTGEHTETSNTNKLAAGILHVLRSLGFKEKLEDSKHTVSNNNISVYSLRKSSINSIFFKTDYHHICNWQVFPSKKWHNNTTMACYIMRKLLTK